MKMYGYILKMKVARINKHILFVLMCALLMGCSGNMSDNETSDESPTTSIEEPTIEGDNKLMDEAEYALEKYKYKIEGYANQSDVYTHWEIYIYDQETGALIQQIQFERDESVVLDPSIYNMIVERDADFDGHTDVLIMRGRFGAQGAAEYACYLWDEEAKMFRESPTFIEIPNAIVDSKNKRILGRTRIATNSYYYRIYEYIDGEYVCVSTLRETFDGAMEYSVLLFYRLKGDEFELVSEYSTDDDEAWEYEEYWDLKSDIWDALMIEYPIP